jgi:predicted house-cleaning noncanonical NTP pyrophosphatase (MazG superfamily)
MNEEEYRQALSKKLVEEALEAASANEHNLITELADLYEVMDTLMAHYDIDPGVVRSTQAHRRSERGGFERRIRLIGISQQ